MANRRGDGPGKSTIPGAPGKKRDDINPFGNTVYGANVATPTPARPKSTAAGVPLPRPAENTGAQGSQGTGTGLGQPRFRATPTPPPQGGPAPAAAPARVQGAPKATAGPTEDALPKLVGPSHEPDIGVGVLLGDRYKLIGKVGSGGMGDVWKAEHTIIGKQMAVKILSDVAGSSDANLPERFMREARAIAAVRHDNIVDVSDFGHTKGGHPYFVMELLDGVTLKDLIKKNGSIPWERARNLLVQLAEGLEAVHAHGIVHRDFKPDNIFVLEKGRGREQCKIIDFGIAKITELDSQAQAFTRTGMVFGTPAFMSPEQARGETVDIRTDIYALGCVAYNMVTGRKPFDGGTPTEVLFKQLFTEAVSPRKLVPHLDIPPGVDAIIMKCLRKSPDLRFSDTSSLRDALHGVGTTAPMVVVPPERLPTPPPTPVAMLTGASTSATAPSGNVSTLPDANDVSTWQIGAPTPAPRDGTDHTGTLSMQRSSGGVAAVVAAVLGLAVLGGGGFFGYQHFLANEAAAVPELEAGPEVVPAEVPAQPVAAPVVPVAEEAAAQEAAGTDGVAAEEAAPDEDAAEAPADETAPSARRRRSRSVDHDQPLPPQERSKKLPGVGDNLPPPPKPAPPPEPAPKPAPEPEPEPAPAPKPKPKPKPKPDGDLVNPFG